MFKPNEKLMWALMEGLDAVLKETKTNEEWDRYHSLKRAVEEIYGFEEIQVTKWGLDGETLKHAPCRRVTLNEIWNYLGYGFEHSD